MDDVATGGGPGERTLLLVEDDDDIREALTLTLSRCGYRVLAARHGRAALEAIAREATPPSLILLDWMMPVMNGLEFLEQLTEAGQTIPVVVVSAIDRVEWTADLPVAVVLTKPVRMRTLIDVVDRLCGQPRRDDKLDTLRNLRTIALPPRDVAQEPTRPTPAPGSARRDTVMMRRRRALTPGA